MFVKVDPATLSSERGGRKERLIDRCHQKSPLFWQTLHNGESKWTNGMARLSPHYSALLSDGLFFGCCCCCFHCELNTTAGLAAFRV